MSLQNFLKCIPSSCTEPVSYDNIKKLIEESSLESWHNIDPKNEIQWNIHALRLVLTLAAYGHHNLLPSDFQALVPHTYKSLPENNRVDLAREYSLGFVKVRHFISQISSTAAPVKTTPSAMLLCNVGLYKSEKTEKQTTILRSSASHNLLALVGK